MEDEQSPVQGENPITVAELDELVGKIFDQKAKIETMETAVTVENKLLAQMEAKAVLYLEQLGRENYRTSRGSIRISEKWRFSLPKTDEDKQAFFNYLREKGLYDKYATVNSNSYNSFLNAEWEIAKQEGRGMEFHIPGVPEPTFHRALGTRKGE